MTSERTPQPGDPLLLDGFEYVLGTGKKQLHDDGRTVTIREFHRPGVLEMQAASARAAAAKERVRAAIAAGDQADAAVANSELVAALEDSERMASEQEPLRLNYNYKKGGTLLDEDLVFAEPPQLRADLKSQADQLIKGNRALSAWAEGASAIQDAALATRKTGAWTLPDRHLLRPPVELRKVGVDEKGAPVAEASKAVRFENREALIIPSRVSDASEKATAILAHSHTYDVTGEG